MLTIKDQISFNRSWNFESNCLKNKTKAANKRIYKISLRLEQGFLTLLWQYTPSAFQQMSMYPKIFNEKKTEQINKNSNFYHD